MIETFVLISGFLFSAKLSGGISAGRLVQDKFKRLYIPALMFGILYVLILDIPLNISAVTRVLNGIGNLWFLPMLFWVFVIYRWAYHSITDKKLLTVLLAVIAVLPYPTLPLQLNNAFYYLFFFHVGCVLANSPRLNRILKIPSVTCVLFVIYIVLFVLSYYIRDSLLLVPDDIGMTRKAVYICARHICRFCYSIVGVLVIYSFFSILSQYVTKNLTAVANLCFGVYLVHEMILRVIYYRLELIDYVSILWLPWLSVLVTLFLSAAIVRFLRSFKYTRSIL